MRWKDKRYHTLNYELRKLFGEKVIKLSINGGFTCPNRDGTVGNRGCLFCSEKGSGDFTTDSKIDIPSQIQKQKQILSRKWKVSKCIAYFQNFTNTYAPLDVLKQRYTTAINNPGIIGLAVATRPDCISGEIIDLLKQVCKTKFLWVELGLQTIHSKSAKLIRRGYPLKTYDKAVSLLNQADIPTVVHLIAGLPGETKEDFLKSVEYVASQNIWGVKLHLLHIVKDADLYPYYKKHPFHLLSRDEYINWICDALEILPESCVIHRLTGDGPRKTLVSNKWALNKLKVLSLIDKELKSRNTRQGNRYKKSRCD